MWKRIPVFWKLSITFFVIIMVVLAADYLLVGGVNLVSKSYLRSIFIILFAFLLSCWVAWFIVNHFIRKPVRRLANSMNMLVEKESEFRLDENEINELRLLATSFKDMASMLTASKAELKESKDYLEGILESTADIIITVSPDGKILMINSGAEKALGYKREEVTGKPIEMIFVDPRDREEALKKMGPMDNIMNYETRFMTKDGKVKHVLNTISRLRDHNGEVISTIGISKDITAEKNLQNQLIQSQRYAAIGQVFTGIQHSMKNMLNACKGGAYMVRLGLKKDERAMFEEGWDIVQEGISRMTDMSMHMLKYVKEWKPNFEPVDLAQICSEIYRVVKPTAKDSDVEFRLNVSPDLPSVLCDAKMIHSAVMDIVSNALDACGMKEFSDEEIPEVILSVYSNSEGKNLILEVKDNGCGMTEDVKKNIFTPFFSTKTRTGTGLGLSITSKMISAHGGAFDIESEPNQGTTFRILLPIDATKKIKEKIDGKKSSGH